MYFKMFLPTNENKQIMIHIYLLFIEYHKNITKMCEYFVLLKNKRLYIDLNYIHVPYITIM